MVAVVRAGFSPVAALPSTLSPIRSNAKRMQEILFQELKVSIDGSVFSIKYEKQSARVYASEVVEPAPLERSVTDSVVTFHAEVQRG